MACASGMETRIAADLRGFFSVVDYKKLTVIYHWGRRAWTALYKERVMKSLIVVPADDAAIATAA